MSMHTTGNKLGFLCCIPAAPCHNASVGIRNWVTAYSLVIPSCKRGKKGKEKGKNVCKLHKSFTLVWRNLKHCWFSTSTNSDSKSWSLYQAPPVTERSGWRLYNMYTFFLDAYWVNDIFYSTLLQYEKPSNIYL